MSALTIYLSRLIGVVTLVIAAAMLADKSLVVAALGHLGQDRAPLLILGFIRVTCGAGIVLVHNVWTRGLWPLVVTFTGWALLVRGVMVLFVPPDAMATLMARAHVVDLYYLYVAPPLVLGAYLSLRGFSVTAPPLDAAAMPAAPPPKPTPPSKPRARRRR
jgi:hypothetical protein